MTYICVTQTSWDNRLGRSCWLLGPQFTALHDRLGIKLLILVTRRPSTFAWVSCPLTSNLGAFYICTCMMFHGLKHRCVGYKCVLATGHKSNRRKRTAWAGRGSNTGLKRWHPCSLHIDSEPPYQLRHWAKTWSYVNSLSKLTIIGSDNGLSPAQRQAIIWTNAGILFIWTLRTNFSEKISESQTFVLKEMHFEKSPAKLWPFCLGLNVFKKCM